MKRWIFILPVVLSACAYQGPTIYAPDPKAPEYQQVVHAHAQYQGALVRWGGVVAETRNFESHTEITLVQFPLTRFGKPISTAHSQGRFIVRSSEFLDPLIFEKGALVTVIGQVDRKITLTIDEARFEAPVIKLQESHVWPERYGDRKRPYNPKHDAPFRGYGYYGTGSHSP